MHKILIRNCQYLVTRPGSIDGIIEDGAVYIEGSSILAVGKSSQLEAQYGQQPGSISLMPGESRHARPGGRP